MKKTVAFFEIPAADFHRAVKFYEALLGTKLSVAECETEKMACFPGNFGAVSWTEGFIPGENGVLVHLHTDDMEAALETATKSGGRITRPKTKIEAEGFGWFSTLVDSEGNRIGLYSDK